MKLVVPSRGSMIQRTPVVPASSPEKDMRNHPVLAPYKELSWAKREILRNVPLSALKAHILGCLNNDEYIQENCLRLGDNYDSYPEALR